MAFDRIAYKNKYNAERSKYNVDLIARWKRIKGCCQCGYKAHHAGLVLDHINPKEKDRTKHGRAYNPGWGKNKIKNELAKCRVMCATCHQVHSYMNEHHSFRV